MVQGSMAINGIFGSGTGSAGATNSFSTGRVNIQTNSNNPLSDDAARVRISESEKAKTEGVESAIRYLNPLQTVVDTASSATDRANEVLSRTLDIAKKVAAEVDPLKKSSLASDGEALIGELAKIADSKTPDGVSVVGQGSLSYSVSLDKQGESQGNSITVNLPDIQLSQSALGLSSITSASLENANAASQESLEQAISTISNIAAALKSTLTQILDTASANGASRAAKGAVEDSNAGELAEKIAAAIKDSPGLADANNLDTAKVLDLLKVAEDNKSQAQTTQTAPEPINNNKNKEDQNEINPLLVSEGEAQVSDEF